MLYILIFNFIISGLWCQGIKKVVVSQGQSFSFDCQHDDIMFFGRRLNKLTKIKENDQNFLYLNLNFNYLKQEDILHVTIDAVQLKNVGYYTCRKSTTINSSMNTVYQLIIPGIQNYSYIYLFVNKTLFFYFKMYNHSIGITYVMVQSVRVHAGMTY